MAPEPKHDPLFCAIGSKAQV